MNKEKRHTWITWIILFSGMTSACLGSSGPRSFGDVAVFRTELERDGFVVRDALFNRVDPQQLFCEGILASGYGFNFDTPYCFYLMPELPEQATAPNAHNMYPWSFRMRADEAVVFVGWTPPEMKYFGYQTYLASRFHPYYKRELRFFVNVGDAINNHTIKTGDGPEGQLRLKPYDAATMIISSPDSGIDARVRKAALAAGCSESIINTEIIPSQLVQFGLGGMSDELVFVQRMAFFLNDPDQKIEKGYFAEDRPLFNEDSTLIGPPYGPNDRGWVFRVTPAAALETKALKPFAMPPLRVRGTGDTREFNLFPAMEKLRSAIIAHYGKSETMEYEDLTTWVWIPEGYDQYQQQEYFTLGPCRDTIYLRCTQFELSEDSTDFVVVYGLNHAMTGKSTYSSLVLYSEDAVPGIPAFADKGEMAGVASVNSERTDGNGLRGSAQRFESSIKDAVPDPLSDPQKFYVWKVTRSSKKETFTLQVPDSPCPRLQLTKLFIAFRAYVEPETHVGPESAEILYDRVIHFRPKSSHTAAWPIDRPVMPGRFVLGQNYPNPSNSKTVIEYSIPERCEVILEMINTRGQVVAQYTQKGNPEHVNRFMVDGTGLASGVYFYRLKAAGNMAIKKMQWIK
jgi:hypothetical protein